MSSLTESLTYPIVYSPPSSLPLKDVRNALAPMAARWRELGVQFGFRQHDLDGIQTSDSSGGVGQWLSSMLDAKINRSPEFSWNDVVAALETLDQHTLARDIRHTFINHRPANPSNGSRLVLSELMEENDVRLREEFADLVVQACRHFESTVRPEEFKTYARTIFVPAPFISAAVSVREMVDAITDHGRWNYLHYRSLLRVIKRYDHGGKLKERCCKYEASVAQFKLTTRIKDWIVKRNIEKHAPQQLKLLPAEYSKLSAKVKINITNETLSYVIQLWNHIAKDLVGLPDLDAVLHDMKEECLLVTWLIPNSDEVKTCIRRKAPISSAFFDQHRIQYCQLDNEYLYKSQDYLGNDDSTSGGKTKHPATAHKSLSRSESQPVSEGTPLLKSSQRSSRTSLRIRRRVGAKAASRSVSINTDIADKTRRVVAETEYISVNGDIVDQESDSTARCCCCVIL